MCCGRTIFHFFCFVFSSNRLVVVVVGLPGEDSRNRDPRTDAIKYYLMYAQVLVSSSSSSQGIHYRRRGRGSAHDCGDPIRTCTRTHLYRVSPGGRTAGPTVGTGRAVTCKRSRRGNVISPNRSARSRTQITRRQISGKRRRPTVRTAVTS